VKLPPRSAVVPAAQPLPNQPQANALLWPSTEYSALRSIWHRWDSPRVPTEEAINTRRREALASSARRAADTLCSETFLQAAWGAKVRIWVLDPKFSTDDDVVLEAIVERAVADDIRILCESHDDSERSRIGDSAALLEDIANGRDSPPPRKINLRWLPRLHKDQYPFLHDRFAIVDDELWHFGATVGGGHKSLNAASRGWNARETLAIQFYERLWDAFDR
jgi:phosphatidylserine/phosphatidylglycerophosphate/cardiolipin synthase-like enzyme